MKRKSKRKKTKQILWIFRGLAILGILLLCLIIGVFIFAEKKLSYLVLGGLGESFSTQIYSAPFEINVNDSISISQLLARLKRLGYQQTTEVPLNKAEYGWNPPTLTLHLRGFQSPYANEPQHRVELTISNNQVNSIRTEDFQGLDRTRLEPELIKILSGAKKVKRDPAEYNEIPQNLIDALVAVEDSRYFGHWGIDPQGIARAVFYNLFKKGGLQGGSTITQQLAKNLFLNPKRTFRRKILEAFLALYLEIRFSKNEILTLYLNHIYMGQDGATSIAGVKSAAGFYFGKKLDELNLAECATLAGLIRSPYKYNPFVNPENAIDRRNFVLKRMQDEDYISHIQLLGATSTPLKLSSISSSQTKTNQFDFFVSEVIRQLLPIYGEDVLFRYGLKIYTTVDPLYQSYAFDAVKDGRHQTALVAMDPQTGYVKACMGGRNFQQSQFNRATQARRQPGSAFKPFSYAAALEQGYTASSLLNDQKMIFSKGTEDEWIPRNFNGVYLGTVTVRQALTNSINMATLDLVQRIGPQIVIDFARRMGIKSDLGRNLAIGLGAFEVTPVELINAYAPFANGGFQISPQFVQAVVDSDDRVLELNLYKRISVLDPNISFIITSMLKSVIEHGTAKNLQHWGWDHPSAGKTGTTNDGKDAWFVGYTSELLTGVWVGDDSAKPIHASGAGNAVPIWANFMNRVYQDVSPAPFVRPDGIIKVKIDPITNKKGRTGCPIKIEEFFMHGTEPTEYCPDHAGGIKGWFKKLFGRSESD